MELGQTSVCHSFFTESLMRKGIRPGHTNQQNTRSDAKRAVNVLSPQARLSAANHPAFLAAE
jgi:hypothetical protein